MIRQEKLMKLTGAAFDDAYAAQMVVDHEKAVTLFKQAFAAETLADDFRTFAQKTLPTLQHHHQEASELQSKLKTASR